MFVIGVANQKGGVGKTTTAINAAAGLALSGKRTLLIDMDPQTNATSGLGQNPDDFESTIFNALMGEGDPQASVHPTGVENLSLIPGDMQLIALERILMAEDHREQRLEKAIQALGERFEYVLIDAPPTLGLLTINTLRAANSLIVPIQSEYYALEGLSLLMETVERVKASLNPHLEILGLLMTMVDGRTNLARQVCQEVLSHFGDKVFRTVIARSVRLSEAPSHGLPILIYDPKSPAAEAHWNLVHEIIARCEEKTKQEQPKAPDAPERASSDIACEPGGGSEGSEVSTDGMTGENNDS